MRHSRRNVLAALAAAPLLPAAACVRGERRTELRTTAGRRVPVWAWKAADVRRGTILFSHGAGSAPWKYPDMIGPWQAAGYDVVAPLHVDSTDHPGREDFPDLKGWMARIEDMRALSQHSGRSGYIAAGHSYGALTALVLGGAEAIVPEGVAAPLRDPRASCVIAFSPPGPMPPLIDAAGYAALAVPALIQTGTRDILPSAGNAPDAWRSHLAAYDAARPGGDRYALVIEGVDHYFGGLICDDSKPGPPLRGELSQAVAVSLLFARSYGTARKDRTVLTRMLGKKGGMRLSMK